MFFRESHADPCRQHATRCQPGWKRLPAIFLIVIAAGHTNAMSWPSPRSEAYKKQLTDINTRLSQLPDPVPSAHPWTLGFRTQSLESATDPQTIEVFFTEPAPVDLVILMPAAHINDGHGLKQLGFPKHFFLERIYEDGSTDLLADYRKKRYPQHGLEPQLFPCPDSKPITGIRLTATEAPLVTAPGKKYYALALSEIFAFAGEQNVALNSRVKTSDQRWSASVWSSAYLVDGFFLFIPTDENYTSYEKDFRVESNHATILYDLGSKQPVDELRIWPSTGSIDKHPTASRSGFPNEIQLHVLEDLNDTTPQLIYQDKSKLMLPGATPFTDRFPSTEGRFFEFTLKNTLPELRTNTPSRIILGELELLQKGRVITREILPILHINNTPRERKPLQKRLTNGQVGSGRICPLRKWLEDFHLQRQLTRQRDSCQAALDIALNREREQTRVFVITGSVLILFLTLMMLLLRLLSQRRWSRMKEQIACDLHDEIGANLSSIAHSSEMAKELIEKDDKELANQLLSQTIDAARLTGDETRHFIQFLEGRDTGEELPAQIRNIAIQILGTIDHCCTFHNTRPFTHLNPAQKWDLLFFVKEAFNNILKHAKANHVDIYTQRKGRNVQLIIADNGCGIPADTPLPRHLLNRANRLKAELEITTNKNQGTQLQLTLQK